MFPELFPKHYDDKIYLFKHTNTQRTEASFKAFVDGLFGENAFEIINPDVLIFNDSLMYPYKNCPTWIKNHENLEMKKFENTKTFEKLISDVSTRLGFTTPLKLQQINDIYQMCRYTAAWFVDKPSPWCVVSETLYHR